LSPPTAVLARLQGKRSFLLSFKEVKYDQDNSTTRPFPVEGHWCERHLWGSGDFAFPIHDAICSDRGLRFVGNCNELNAAYAADGYARIHGIAAVNTTYGVGELSAINGIAGSYAEHLPVFHLVGMPTSGVQAAHRLVHHTLGNGEFDLFYKMAEPVVCAQAIMTADNCVSENERLIPAAPYHRRPVYLAFPGDYTNKLSPRLPRRASQ
jgi:indolepyruvate decarboxylase